MSRRLASTTVLRRFTFAAALGLAVATLSAVSTPAYANGCNDEEVKFISSGRSDSYGSMGSLYVYDRTLYACSSVANTVFLSMADAPQLDYIEIGTRQFGPNPTSFSIFQEYVLYPNDDYTQSVLTWPENTWIAFNSSNLTGQSYTWKTQYRLPGYCCWANFGPTPTALENHGRPFSEISRYGHADASVKADQLQYRPSTGGWFRWTFLGCSTAFPNSITDWDAIASSTYSWYTVRQPVNGNC